jgi:LacI family transcriptional regulator
MTDTPRYQRRAVAPRPTLAQVAELAGVSLKTASRALNSEPNVAEPTRARVRVAADRLGFRLNGIARDLRQGATSTLVGLISGDLADPFHSAVASGVERELRGDGLQLVVSSTDHDPEREPALVEAFVQRRVRALLIMSPAGRPDRLASGGTGGVPLVLLARRSAGLAADAVVIDDRGGGRQAGEHLLAGGHRRIAVIHSADRTPPHNERLAGFAEAMTAAGNREWRAYRCGPPADPHAAGRTAATVLTSTPAPTALFTLDHRLTAGALCALGHRAGPPALIGFDDLPLGEALGVSVVTYDSGAMGATATRLALERAAGRCDRPRTVITQTHIVSIGSGEITPRP